MDEEKWVSAAAASKVYFQKKLVFLGPHADPWGIRCNT
jgi:hypothetical protein